MAPGRCRLRIWRSAAAFAQTGSTHRNAFGGQHEKGAPMRLDPRRVAAALLGVGLLGVTAAPASAQKNPQRDAFFGETHVHTSWSFDAYIFGNTITGPA